MSNGLPWELEKLSNIVKEFEALPLDAQARVLEYLGSKHQSAVREDIERRAGATPNPNPNWKPSMGGPAIR